ncbi:hypothetical protein GOP47_0025189, partial [Adiantum capillus-veneris]
RMVGDTLRPLWLQELQEEAQLRLEQEQKEGKVEWSKHCWRRLVASPAYHVVDGREALLCRVMGDLRSKGMIFRYTARVEVQVSELGDGVVEVSSRLALKEPRSWWVARKGVDLSIDCPAWGVWAVVYGAPASDGEEDCEVIKVSRDAVTEDLIRHWQQREQGPQTTTVQMLARREDSDFGHDHYHDHDRETDLLHIPHMKRDVVSDDAGPPTNIVVFEREYEVTNMSPGWNLNTRLVT